MGLVVEGLRWVGCVCGKQGEFIYSRECSEEEENQSIRRKGVQREMVNKYDMGTIDLLNIFHHDSVLVIMDW